jgi:MIP family channel proteins
MADNDMVVPAKDFNAEAYVPDDVLVGWVRPLMAEFIGPFALVFIGAGSILTALTQGFDNGGTLLLVALAHGLAIGLMVAAAGHISGGHYNPAVTIGLFLGGKIGLMKSAGYIIAQLLGATVAAVLLDYIFDKSLFDVGNTVPTVNYGGDGDLDGLIIGRERTLLIEIIATFFLVYVIHGVAVDSRGAHAIAALAIGLTITMDILMAGPLTGAAMNPARAFGPALVAGEWTDWWVYWVGPIIGAVLASIVHNYIFIPRAVGFPEPTPSEHHP